MSGMVVAERAQVAPNGAVMQQAQPPLQVGNFDGNTRHLRVPLPNELGVTSGELVNIRLPRNGLLAGIGAAIDLTITGTPGTPNPIGQAVAIRSIRFYQGGGNATIDITGPGYFYAMAYMFELGQDMASYTTARSAVAATTSGKLDFYLPMTPNMRDAVGLINLQSRQTTWTLDIQFETDAVISGTVATISADVYPFMDIFTVPDDPANYPTDKYLQRILEDKAVYTGAIQQPYSPLVGDVYLQLAHLVGGDLVAAVDSFTDATLRFNQSSYVQTLTPRQLDIVFRREHQATRPKGLILYDLVAQAGLGNYDKLRDVIDSKRVSDFESLWTQSSTPLTVRTVRRMMTKIG